MPLPTLRRLLDRRALAAVDAVLDDGRISVVVGWSVDDRLDLRLDGRAPISVVRFPRVDVRDAIDAPGWDVGFVATFDGSGGGEAVVELMDVRKRVTGRFPMAATVVDDLSGAMEELGVDPSLARRDGGPARDEQAASRGPAVMASGSKGVVVDAAMAYRGRIGLVAGWLDHDGPLRAEAEGLPADSVACVRIHRPDVADHLLQKGSAPRGAWVGFLVTYHDPGPDAGRPLKIDLTGQGGERIGTIAVRPEGAEKVTDVFAEAQRLLAGPSVAGLERTRTVLDPLRRLDSGEHAKVAEIVEYGPVVDADHDLTVIVPFYKEYGYLLDQIEMQSLRTDLRIEWLFVCDDPSIVVPLKLTLRTRRRLLKHRTRLIVLDRNYGYAEANNAGLRNATGRCVMALNSDAIAYDLSCWSEAVSRLDAESEVGLIGFRLLFEDDTIQHDGMSFVTQPGLADLIVCDHPGKGLPPLGGGEDLPRPVEAVTGAAMMARRADLGDAFFASGYIQGDFEDADLNLKMRAAGRSILCWPSASFYHLERQSLRHIGDQSGRSALVLANCLTFNERWGSFLDQQGPSS